jgi:hypothetical protein
MLQAEPIWGLRQNIIILDDKNPIATKVNIVKINRC